MTARLDKLRNALAASLKSDGTPAPGYGERCKALAAEIYRLEILDTARGFDIKDPADDMPSLPNA